MASRLYLSRRRFLAGSATAVALAFAPSHATQVGATSTGYRRVNANGVRLRSGPGTGYGVLMSLTSGTEVLYLEDGGWANGYQWAKVEVNAGSKPVGYLAAEFLSPLQGPGEFPIGTMVHVDAAGGRANLRDAPNGSVIQVLDNGLTGTVQDGPSNAGGYDWYRISFGDTVGWMASIVLAAGGGDDRSIITVVDGPLRVRQSPGLSGAVVGSAVTGARGIVTTEMPQDADGYTWINVQFTSGLEGWVASAFVAWD